MSRRDLSRKTKSRSISLVGLLALGLGAPSTVLAQGYSTDIELVRPTFSYKGLPGIDTPVMAAQPTMRTGFMAQYERDPVILYQFGEELGGDGNGADGDGGDTGGAFAAGGGADGGSGIRLHTPPLSKSSVTASKVSTESTTMSAG